MLSDNTQTYSFWFGSDGWSEPAKDAGYESAGYEDMNNHNGIL